MKKFKLALIATTYAFLSNNALAQSKTNDWEGAYGQIGVGYEVFLPASATGTTTIPAYKVTLANSSSAKNAQGPAGNFSAGYNFAINTAFVLGIGATIYPGDSASATSNSTTTGIPGSAAGVYNIANVFAIYLTPGYTIDKDRLAYLKIGYTGAIIHTSSAGNFPQQSTNVSGIATGLGYKQMLNESFYGFGEVNYAAYSPKPVSVLTDGGATVNTSSKGSGVDLIVGAGYRF